METTRILFLSDQTRTCLFAGCDNAAPSCVFFSDREGATAVCTVTVVCFYGLLVALPNYGLLRPLIGRAFRRFLFSALSLFRIPTTRGSRVLADFAAAC